MHIMSNKGLSSFDLHTSSHNTASELYPETGIPQGDTPSQANWHTALDILLRALHDIDPTPSLVRTDIVLHSLADTAYTYDFFQYQHDPKDFSSRRTPFQPSPSFLESK